MAAGPAPRARAARAGLAAGLLAALALAGCATAPRVIQLQPGPALDGVAGDVTDYPSAFRAVGATMTRELGLPVPAVALHLYPDPGAVELGLVTELRFAPATAREVARYATGISGRGKVLANEGRLATTPWPDRVRWLAHEVTHTVQYELSGGRRGTSDQWLREGYADWVSFRVLDALRLEAYAARRTRRLNDLRQAAARGPVPRLADLITFDRWVEHRNRLGAGATYAQAFLATDFLIERHGPDAAVRYFRLCAGGDRAGNFREAFGEDFEAFAAAWADRLGILQSARPGRTH